MVTSVINVLSHYVQGVIKVEDALFIAHALSVTLELKVSEVHQVELVITVDD